MYLDMRGISIVQTPSSFRFLHYNISFRKTILTIPDPKSSKTQTFFKTSTCRSVNRRGTTSGRNDMGEENIQSDHDKDNPACDFDPFSEQRFKPGTGNHTCK